MTAAPPPLLAPLCAGERGYVLYKAYPPQRGDDVEALLELATVLPPTVQFKPLAPSMSYLLDIRRLLPAVLTTWQDWAEGLAAKPASRFAALPEVSCPTPRDKLLPFLAQAVNRVLGKDRHEPGAAESDLGSAKELCRWLEAQHSDVLRVLLHIVSPPPPPKAPADAGTFREQFQVSAEAPTLVVGRPEDFGGYGDPGLDEPEWTDFRRLMERAGYANRFYFQGSELSHRICDRKTQHIHNDMEPGENDFGFILLSRLNTGQPVMVATGTSSLGTYAAVRLLLQDRPCFRRALDTFNRQKGPICVDIGFRCSLEHLSGERPFPLAHPSERLSIDVLNPGDLVGYTWSRVARQEFKFLLDSRRLSAPHEDECMCWSEDAAKDEAPGGAEHSRRITIVIKRPQLVNANQCLLPSARTYRELAEILRHLELDGKDWQTKLKKWRHDLDEVERDRSYRTFRPILLLGATGVGKQWVAELIANRWAGETLAPARKTPLNAAHESLKRRLAKWTPPREDSPSPGGSSALLTFSAVSYPKTLLDTLLFGRVEGVATEVRESPGAFIMAGTGVLFLDELLELPLEQQSRLLVALQTGRVWPIGAWRSYAYVCRLIAATNRASNEAELNRLISRGKIRRDLVARFERRYVLPPLQERALEIIPILIELIRTDRLLETDPHKSPTVRISRRALEVLASYSYPENIRDLRRLVSNLPDELVASFRKPGERDSRDETEASRHTICLRHLSQFGVGPTAGKAAHPGAAAEADEGVPNESRLADRRPARHDRPLFEFRLKVQAPRSARHSPPPDGLRASTSGERQAIDQTLSQTPDQAEDGAPAHRNGLPPERPQHRPDDFGSRPPGEANGFAPQRRGDIRRALDELDLWVRDKLPADQEGLERELSSLLNLEGFSEWLGRLYELLFAEHRARKHNGGRGLFPRDLKEMIAEEAWPSPFANLRDVFPKNERVREVLAKWEEKIRSEFSNQDKEKDKEKEGEGTKRRSGRPPSLLKGVLLSVLMGRVITDRDLPTVTQA